tara:strand:- start:48717 stop:51338 length:2622 start_codon:yes stop_codon:yes gene_type:complete
MNEIILNTLYILSKIPLISHVFRVFYWWNALVAGLLLKGKDNKFVAIKGGYARGDFELIVSDIDFVVVATQFKMPVLLKWFCPLVKDIDVYDEEEFELRLKYGGLKYSDFKTWKVLKGKLPDANYLYYPEKIKIDIVEEIYFYYEWVFENIKLGKTKYRKACLLRNLKKVRSLIPNVITSGEDLAKINAVDLNNVNSLSDIVNYFKTLTGLIPCSKRIEANEYIIENFDFNEELPTEFKKIYLNQNMLDVFFGNGAIDTYYIYKELINCENKILGHLQTLRYFFKILDGKINHVHDSVKDISLKERIQKAKDILKNFKVYNFNGLYQGKTVYITASWGNDYLNRLLEAHKLNHNVLGQAVEYVHISLGGDERFFQDVDSVTTLRVENLTMFKGLWHKESLFNLAIDFISGADSYIFADIDAVIPRASWLMDLKDSLDKHEVIQPFKTFIDEKTKGETYSSVAALEHDEEVFYAPGLIWAFSQKGMEKIKYFYDYFHDGSNDGVLFKEVTKTKIGMIEKLDWTSKHIEDYVSDKKYLYSFLDYQLSHISHPLPKHYVNMILYFNMILPLLEKALVKTDYGLWAWRDDVDTNLQNLFAQFRKDRGYCSYAFLEALKPYLEEVLKHKTQKSIFFFDDAKNLRMQTEKGEVALFVGDEINGMTLFFANINEGQRTLYHQDLENFEKDNTYNLSFIIKTDEDISEMVKLHISKLKLMDLILSPKQINTGLWMISTNFYTWEKVESPLLEVEYLLGEKLELTIESHEVSSVQKDKDWEWFSEKKDKKENKKKKHILRIEKELTVKWYKAALILKNHSLNKYKVSIVDNRGMQIYLPRFQENASDYIDIFFKVVTNTSYIDFVIETDEETSFDYELVVFY